MGFGLNGTHQAITGTLHIEELTRCYAGESRDFLYHYFTEGGYINVSYKS